MQAEAKQKIQVVLIVMMAIAAIRVGYIFYERRSAETTTSTQQAPPLSADAYVAPKKLHPYDVTTAREQLTAQPVWAKVGYAVTYFPYHRVQRRTDFAHDAGKLLPLERVEINDVVTAVSPDAPGVTQVMAIFDKGGQTYAFQVGTVQESDFRFLGNDILFVQDPHELYKHWAPDIWQAIDRREIKPGMNELQGDFAIGLGIPQGAGPPGDRTLQYPNGGHPLVVTYQNGQAVSVRAGPG